MQALEQSKLMVSNNDKINYIFLDPLCPTTNLFYMRPEHAFHLDNMIFFACCEFLRPRNEIS
jgi:hypothetical protein